MSDPATIPAADWHRLTAGCRDQDEVRRVLAGIREGYSMGQRSILATIHESVMTAISTPQPPSEEESR